MTSAEIRNHIFTFFKILTSDDYQKVGNYKSQTNIQSVRDYLRNNVPTTRPDEEVGRNQVVLEIINQWISNGLLTWGNKHDFDTGHFGFITVTTYGEECFQTENILPYDPDQYLNEYRSQVPQADGITLEYLGESISAYNRDMLLSSAITLGVASENAIILLIDSFTQAISDQNRRSRFQTRIRNRWISIQFSEFRQESTHFQNQLPPNLRQDLDTYLEGIFNFIRLNRNQAGHPTGSRPTKKVALHNIQMFVDYSKRVFELKDFFDNNSLT